MKILVLDNYDSFTYNLVQYVRELADDDQVTVRRNDAISLDEVAAYDAIILSPGPGVPSEAGIMPQVLERYAHSHAILGVCLGHQAIGEHFGGEVVNLSEVYHGVDTEMTVREADPALFAGLPKNFRAGRYHSWAVDPDGLPAALVVTATDEHGAIMAVRHTVYNVRGVQFHPESIMTEHGKQMIANWLEYQRSILAERNQLDFGIA